MGTDNSPIKSLDIESESQQEIFSSSYNDSIGISKVSFHNGFLCPSSTTLVVNFLSQYSSSTKGSILPNDSVLRCSLPYMIVMERLPPRSSICLLFIPLLVESYYDLKPRFLDPGDCQPPLAYKLGILIIVPFPDYLKLLSSSFILTSVEEFFLSTL